MEVKKISRGEIIVDDNGTLVRVLGEAMAIRTDGENSEYVVYENSVLYADSNENITDAHYKEKILAFIKEDLKKKNLDVVVE
mgnify:CR=1 FL=1